jgi:uncharacterized OB-fold protein
VQAFIPGVDPYCIGLIQLEEQEDVRLIGLLVDCTVDSVAVGLGVAVDFLKRAEGIWIPIFRVVAK